MVCSRQAWFLAERTCYTYLNWSLKINVHIDIAVGIKSCGRVNIGSIKRIVVQMRRPMDVQPVGAWTSLSNSVISDTCHGQGDTLTSDDRTQLERIDAIWTPMTKYGYGDIEIRCLWPDLHSHHDYCHRQIGLHVTSVHRPPSLLSLSVT